MFRHLQATRPHVVHSEHAFTGRQPCSYSVASQITHNTQRRQQVPGGFLQVQRKEALSYAKKFVPQISVEHLISLRIRRDMQLK